MTRRLLAVIALSLLASLPTHAASWEVGGGSTGATVCDANTTLKPLEYNARDTYTLRFVGRTLTGTPTVTATCISCYQTDSSASSIVYGTPSVSGSDLFFAIAPDTGCGTSGCRSGNWYMITAATSDGTNLPVAKVCLQVTNQRFSVQ